MAAPIISEEGRGLNRKKKKKKPRVSEPGALVIEHAEASDAGLLSPTFLLCFLPVGFVTPSKLLPLFLSLSLTLRRVHLRGLEPGGRRHPQRVGGGGLSGLVVRH